MKNKSLSCVVLVTGVGSNIGQGIVKALRMTGRQHRIIGVDMIPMSAGLFRCDKGYIMPPADSATWSDRIIEICKKEKVNIILAGSDAEIPFFSAEKERIELETGSFVLVSVLKLVKILDDKWETAKFLSSHGLNSPRSVLGDSFSLEQLQGEWRFPLLVKPRKGAGSRGVFTVNSVRELEYAMGVVKDPLIQNYIQGDEFTSGIFYDKNSVMKGIITMKRELHSGTTYRAIADDFPEVNDEIIRVAKVLATNGAIGPMNIQTKLFSGKTYTFEINPRFSGTTVFRAKFNFNEPEMAVRHFVFDEDIPELKPSKGLVMRYWDEVYVPLEALDTIEREGAIEAGSSEILRLL